VPGPAHADRTGHGTLFGDVLDTEGDFRRKASTATTRMGGTPIRETLMRTGAPTAPGSGL